MKFIFKMVFIFILFCPILNAKRNGQNYKIQKRDEHFCIVEEHEKQMTTFNFMHLTNETNDYIIKRDDSEGGSVYVQLCSSLKNNCTGKTGYSVCLKKKDKEIGIGKSPPRVEFNSSRITFHFTGDKCNKTSNYTTIIIMQCDYNASGNNSFPQIIPHAEDQCDIYLIWSTIYACGPRHKTNCSAFDTHGHEYDLSSLMLSSYNYEVPVNKSVKIILNVCHTLIYGNGASCNRNSASCLQKSTGVNSSYFDIGEVGNPPFFDDKGILKIEYNSGGICHVDINNPHLGTIIAFICDPTAENTIPKYVNGSETCNYYLEWKTPLACKESLRNQTLIPITKNQVIVNPTTLVTKKISEIKSASDSQIKCARINDEINLLQLIRTKDDYIVKTNDSEFYINVCNPLVSTDKLTACDGSSACQIHYGEVKQEISLGKLEGSPVIDKNKNVVLQYKGGTTCVENQKDSISSNLSFVCNYTANADTPKFLEYTNCTYLFKWETRFVCGAVVGNFYDNCTISNPLSQTINLSPLGKQTFYLKNSKAKDYSISLCGNNSTSKSSTVCQGENGYGSSVNVIYVYSNNSVNLQYTKGTKCLDGTFESEIKFVCNLTAGIGVPKLIGESECSVHFEWQTNVICSSLMNTPSENPTTSSETKDGDAKKEIITSNYGGLEIFITISGIVIIVVTAVLLRNPSRRARFYRFLSNPCSSSSSNRVKYCRVNTTEEAHLLLDNVDPTTVCQSDSDDDLLGA